MFPDGFFLPKIRFVFTGSKRLKIHQEADLTLGISSPPHAFYMRGKHLLVVDFYTASIIQEYPWRYNISSFCHEVVHYLQELFLGADWMGKARVGQRIEKWPCRVSCVVCWLLLTHPTEYERELAQW